MSFRYRSHRPDDEVTHASEARQEGKYANYFVIGHNASEFLLDFGQMFSSAQENIHSRVITSPRCARELLNVLGESITTYEREFGAIGDLYGAPIDTKPDQL